MCVGRDFFSHLSRSNSSFEIKISKIIKCVGENFSINCCTINRQVGVVKRLSSHFVGKYVNKLILRIFYLYLSESLSVES